MMTPPVLTSLYPLNQVLEWQEVGTKAFNLGRLFQLGMPSAKGVVIPNAMFQTHLDHAHLHESIARLEVELSQLDFTQIRQASADIQARILAQPLSEQLLQELTESIAFDEGQRYAVRSSALGEDAHNASFAGQLRSVLHVQSSFELSLAIRQVWASLYSESLLNYAKHKGLFLRKMGVVIQAQVDAQLSGVLFSRLPNDVLAPKMLVELCAGLGEDLVSGVITPSSLQIDRDDGRISLDTSELCQQLSPEQLACFSQLRDHALTLERAFSAPQDIEWSIDQNSQLVLLQARPITHFSTHSKLALKESSIGKASAATTEKSLVYWSNANIAENFPDPVTPFLHSIVTRGYSAYFRNLGRGFGLSERAMRALSAQFEQVVGVHMGRLYYNLSHIHQLIHLAPAGAWLAQSFNVFTGANESPDVVQIPKRSRLARVLLATRIAVKIVWQYARVQTRVAQFESEVLAFSDRCQPAQLAQHSTAQLHQHLRDFLSIRLEKWNGAALADTAAMACYGMLKQFLARALPQQEQAQLHHDLLKGIPDLISAKPVSELWLLSRQIRADMALLTLFQQTDAALILAQFQQGQHPEFYAKFTAYLSKWGFRSSGELMLIHPTPYENPVPTLRVLQQYVREAEHGPDQLSAQQAQLRENATDRVAQQLGANSVLNIIPLASRVSRFRLLLNWTHASIRLRERARFKQALLYTRLRHIALHLGARLQQQGILDQQEDVFFLTVDEVLALANGSHLLAHSILDTVAARRLAFEAYVKSDNVPPDSFCLPTGEQWHAEQSANFHTDVKSVDADSHGQRLFGISACGGRIQGTANVVLDVSDAHRIRSGDILVTKQTDPGWASVFFLVKGLVIERGGMLSHGAIIAREYGIPAVVGVAQASTRIRDGAEIFINADQAWVDLLSTGQGESV